MFGFAAFLFTETKLEEDTAVTFCMAHQKCVVAGALVGDIELI
jgi:hypothetical protein